MSKIRTWQKTEKDLSEKRKTKRKWYHVNKRKQKWTPVINVGDVRNVRDEIRSRLKIFPLDLPKRRFLMISARKVFGVVETEDSYSELRTEWGVSKWRQRRVEGIWFVLLWSGDFIALKYWQQGSNGRQIRENENNLGTLEGMGSRTALKREGLLRPSWQREWELHGCRCVAELWETHVMMTMLICKVRNRVMLFYLWMKEQVWNAHNEG